MIVQPVLDGWIDLPIKHPSEMKWMAHCQRECGAALEPAKVQTLEPEPIRNDTASLHKVILKDIKCILLSCHVVYIGDFR